MHRFRALGALWFATVALFGPLGQGRTAAGELDVTLTALLDGVPIPLKVVANYYCDDLSYPVIQCSRKPSTIETRATLSLLGGTTYVTMYDQPNFGGAYMNVSQDYSTLITIGWNDRVSSFRARNGESGEFTTDWLFGGSAWPFCCSSQLSTLGAYDNLFSSVRRT